MAWDTRRANRQPISVVVQIQLNPASASGVHLAKGTVEGKIVDVSTQGMGFLSDTFLPVGTLVDFAIPRSLFCLPNRPVPAGSMEITGRIVYARPHAEGCRFGVSIVKIEETDRALLKDFVASKERRQVPRIPLT